jgi:hypothetical protein
VPRTWSSSSVKGIRGSTRERRTTVLTKNPTTSSSSARPRPEADVPTAMSRWSQ